MRKELHPDQPQDPCDLCGRTLLKGERAETYLVPGGQRRRVCDLCAARATAEGWIRESAHGDLPAARRRPEPRRSLIGRLRRRSREDEPAAPTPASEAEVPDQRFDRDVVQAPEPEGPARRPGDDVVLDGGHDGPKDPRHVRAVPTNAEVKVERALELFNASEHPRTIAGIARSLGDPWVSANPDPLSPSEVVVVVAWELSWYRYRVDLGDAEDPVGLVAKGEELAELDDELREWNGQAAEDGYLAAGVGSSR